jgi:hypothetical protein
MLGAWYRANVELEHGIVAEMEGKPQPKRFRAALSGYEEMGRHMEALDRTYAELIEIDKKGTIVPEWGRALAKIFADARPFRRVRPFGTRRADAAGVKAEEEKLAPLRSSRDLVEAQRADLRILRQALPEVLDGFRSALPLTEKGEFVRVMLSGRNAFGDKMPQFTDMVSVFQRFVTEGNMLTIDATMQVFPKGWEWLPGQGAEPGPPATK